LRAVPGERSRGEIHRLELPHGYGDCGLTVESRALYALLAAEGPLAPDPLDQDALRSLLDLGLAVVTDAGIDVVPPVGPLGDLAKRHTASVAAAHEAIDDLSRIWRTARAPTTEVAILSGATATRTLAAAFRSAQREILGLSIGPRDGRKMEPAPGLLDALERGVTVRAIYHSGVFASAEAIAIAEMCIAAGEQARVFPVVPVNLIILDDVAVMNVSYNTDEPLHLAFAQSRRVTESWRAIFDSYWQLAMPLDAHSPMAEAPEEFQQLVRLLSLGLTDRAIARELGVSERTVGRRVTRLQEHLGADTRFQLGLQLATRGWQPGGRSPIR